MTAPPLEADLGNVVGEIFRGWRRIAAGVLLGTAAGGAIVLFVPARFDASALVLVRTQDAGTGAIASKLGALAQFAPGGLSGALKDELETELALLRSRAVLGIVVDSLRLQVRLRNPERVPALTLVDSVQLPGRFKPVKATLQPGLNTIAQGKVWVRGDAPAIRVELIDREDAIDWVQNNFDARKTGGDVVLVAFRALDSLTSAAVPNLAIATYLVRRKTVDRGLNQRRLATELRVAQDAGGIPALEPAARAALDRVVALERAVGELRSEQGALDSLLAEAPRGGADVRRLAAFPALLRSPAVNDIVSQLSHLETQRAALEVTYSSSAAPVRAVVQARDSLLAQLLPLASTYARSLARQRATLEQDLARARQQLLKLPGAAQGIFLAEAKLQRLATLDAGMGAQVLDARMAALTEGGDVRLIDPAVAPRKVAFPRPLLTMALGALVGLLSGVAFSLLAPPSRTRAA